jgi:hypothetical protein
LDIAEAQMRKSTQRAAVKSIIGMSLLRATRADQTVEANWIKLDIGKWEIIGASSPTFSLFGAFDIYYVLVHKTTPPQLT